MVGMNFFESSCCSWKFSGNAAIPAMMPIAMNKIEIRDQITPQQREEPPYR